MFFQIFTGDIIVYTWLFKAKNVAMFSEIAYEGFLSLLSSNYPDSVRVLTKEPYSLSINIFTERFIIS